MFQKSKLGKDVTVKILAERGATTSCIVLSGKSFKDIYYLLGIGSTYTYSRCIYSFFKRCSTKTFSWTRRNISLKII